MKPYNSLFKPEQTSKHEYKERVAPAATRIFILFYSVLLLNFIRKYRVQQFHNFNNLPESFLYILSLLAASGSTHPHQRIIDNRSGKYVLSPCVRHLLLLLLWLGNCAAAILSPPITSADKQLARRVIGRPPRNVCPTLSTHPANRKCLALSAHL